MTKQQERRVYMVHKGSRATTTTRKAEALELAQREGAKVSYIPWSLWREGGPYGWDMPSFLAYATPLSLPQKQKRVRK